MFKKFWVAEIEVLSGFVVEVEGGGAVCGPSDDEY